MEKQVLEQANSGNSEFQITDSNLLIESVGSVIGIGRTIIPKEYIFDHVLPTLSYVVMQAEYGRAESRESLFVSTCIHLQIDGHGKTVLDARYDMFGNILDFLYENFTNEKSKANCWLNLLDLFESNEEKSILWNKYHTFQLMLSERRNIGADIYHMMETLAAENKELSQKVEGLTKELTTTKIRAYRAEELQEHYHDLLLQLREHEHQDDSVPDYLFARSKYGNVFFDCKFKKVG